MAKPGFYANRSINGIVLGVNVRKQFNKQYIFRTRRGNGSYGSVDGKIYHDKMAYFVPLSIDNAAGEPSRRQWIAAVDKWKYDLTAEEKADYNLLASKGLHMSGYNLFMRRAMKGEIDMFVDRGDPAAYDFRETDLTMNNTWQILNLSSIVPAGAKAVFFKNSYTDSSVGAAVTFRKYGNSNDINAQIARTVVLNQFHDLGMIVACDSNRRIEYKFSQVFSSVYISIAGWWT